MGKQIKVVTKDGDVQVNELFKLTYLFILSGMCLVTALAINGLVRKIMDTYIGNDDSVLGYFIYALISIALVVLMVYIGFMLCPDLDDYVSLSPL